MEFKTSNVRTDRGPALLSLLLFRDVLELYEIGISSNTDLHI